MGAMSGVLVQIFTNPAREERDFTSSTDTGSCRGSQSRLLGAASWTKRRTEPWPKLGKENLLL